MTVMSLYLKININYSVVVHLVMVFVTSVLFDILMCITVNLWAAKSCQTGKSEGVSRDEDAVSGLTVALKM